MASHEKRTFSLPAALAKSIDEMVTSGAYGSGSEVVKEGLRWLLEREEAVERWHEEIADAYEARHGSPGRMGPSKEGSDRHAGRQKIA